MHVLIWWTCLLFCQVSLSLGNKPRFGETGKYTCHCEGGNCDHETGVCSSGKCESGWSGENCQKENVALNKTTWQSSTYSDGNHPTYYTSDKAVDGNTVHTNSIDSCTHTDVGKKNAEWGVDLQQSYPVQEIKIYVRDDPHYKRLKGFKLYVGETNTTRTECHHQAEVNPEFTVRCNNIGRYVIITNDNPQTNTENTYVNLCEVEVNVCAVGTYGPNCSSLCYCEDGSERCDVTNGCKSGCILGYEGRYCNKTCDSDKYGRKCEGLCSKRHCLKNQSSCNHTDGRCDEGKCLPGWKGVDCTQSNKPRFGETFKYTCHCEGGNCDHETGFCSSGKCQSGWSGENCQKENVALNKTTWQSSTYSDGNHPHSYTSDKAVDGDTVHTASTDSCTHTAGGKPNAEWGVDLQQSYPVQEIKIYVRDKPHYTRLEGFKLYVGETNTTRTQCHHQAEVKPEFKIRCNNTGRYVIIFNDKPQTNTKNTYVNLCEVEVNVCAVGTYGPNCSSLCYCQDDSERCDVTNGCKSGCISGYEGTYCNKSNKPKFGETFKYTCHCVGGNCDNKTGVCSSGKCQSGWSGENCQKENVALNKTTWQSSTYSDGNHPNSYTSDKAVDGDTVHTASTDSCTHTDVGKRNAEWGVDLQQSYPVQEIKIYVRDKPHYTRLEGFKLYVGETNTTRTECHHQAEVKPEFKIRCNITGRYVIITNDKPQTNTKNTYVNLCEVEVNVCAVGTYGPNCSSLCYCQDDSERCDVTNGCKSGCISGYEGRYCNKICAVGTYGPNCSSLCYCEDDSERCDVTNGCKSGCISGYEGPYCNKKCNDGILSQDNIYYGKYGAGCMKGCYYRNCLNRSSICNYVTGECIGGCKNGYEDIDCNKTCDKGPEGKYGAGCSKYCSRRHCSEPNSSCNHVTGKCIGGCSDGYIHDDCTKACGFGKYGRKCEGLCGNRHCENNQSSCNHKDGRCDNNKCLPGWKGVDCTQECSNGTYGSGCSKNCSDRHCSKEGSSCDNIKGECTEGCIAGYDGEDCTRECMKGFYGAGCKENCSSRQCWNSNSSCDHVTGRCDQQHCLDGWTNEDCRKKCSNGTYGSGCSKKCSNRHCSKEGSSCDNIKGECTEGCSAGYDGEDCTRECTEGFYGAGCKENCSSRQCRNSNSSCDHVTGRCDKQPCLDGWTNEDCTKKCNDGSTDENGVAVGTYGANCSSSCQKRHCGHNTSKCDHVSGECDGGCEAGYEGKDCMKQCSDGTYGNKCVFMCNNRKCKNHIACPPRDGACHNAICLPGYKLANCTLKIEANLSLTYGLGAAVALLLVAIVCVVVFVVYRRRKKPKETNYDDKKVDENWEENSKEDDTPIYMNTGIQLSTLAASVEPRKSDNSPVYQTVDKTRKGSAKPAARKPSDENSEYMNTLAASVEPRKSDNSPVYQTVDKTRKRSAKPAARKPSDENSEYMNVGNPVFVDAASIPLSDIQNILNRMDTAQDSWFRMYKNLPSGFTAPYDDSQLKQNRPKNRYAGYYPYDHTRVILESLEGVSHSDYINASYVDSYQAERFFIAAQGPTKVTINDFVRMIFEHKIEKIVMLTNLIEGGKHKCERYWPEKDIQVFHDLELRLVEEIDRTSFTLRSIAMKHKKSGKTHDTMMFHFKVWSDHGVPEVHDMLDFLYRVQSYKPDSTSPILVHCSAGIGRTGTFIAIDTLLKEGKATGYINVANTIKTMREQRVNLIQTPGQLSFIYRALVNGFKFGKTTVSAVECEQMAIVNKNFHLTNISREKELAILKNVHCGDKNNRIYVSDKPQLNILTAASWKIPVGYIVTEVEGHGMESVWNLIRDQSSEVAIALLKDSTNVPFCPHPGTDVVIGALKIFSEAETGKAIKEFTITTVKEASQHVCTLFVPSCEDDSGLFTSSATKIVDLIRKVDSCDTGQYPVTVITSNMSDGGMFCILRNVLQRKKADRQVEIFNATRSILKTISTINIDKEKYDFIYEVASRKDSEENVYENY